MADTDTLTFDEMMRQCEEAEREYANASPWLRALMDQVYKEVTTHDR